MYKDPEPELVLQADETTDDFTIETTVEIDTVPPLSERLIHWIESVDR